jgi:hypothetical protein
MKNKIKLLNWAAELKTYSTIKELDFIIFAATIIKIFCLKFHQCFWNKLVTLIFRGTSHCQIDNRVTKL